MLKLIHLIAICLVIPLIQPCQGQAYFKVPDVDPQKDGFLLLKEGTVFKQDPPFHPVLYDQWSPAISHRARKFVMAGKSPLFIALDESNMTSIPLYSNRIAGDSGFLLSNLIYSNLRIQMLIRHYLQLQEQASRVATMAGPITTFRSGMDPVSISNPAGVHADLDVLESELDYFIHSLINRIQNNDNTFAIMQLRHEALAELKHREVNVEEIIDNLHTVRSSTLKRQTPILNSVETSESFAQSDIKNDINRPKGNKSRDTLPWLIKYPLVFLQYIFSVLKYFVAHKAETVVVLLSLFVIITIATSSRSR